MNWIIRFYKVSFLIGAHAAGAAWGVGAIKLAMDGQFGPATTFAGLSFIMTTALVIWWHNR
jgi:hypothetical protein